MALLHLSLGSLTYLHAIIWQVSIKSMQYMEIALQYKASSYSILIKCKFYNFALRMPLALHGRGHRPVRLPLHSPGYCVYESTMEGLSPLTPQKYV